MKQVYLKIKPPPTRWSPLATMGLFASIGSFVGTLVPPAEFPEGPAAMVFVGIAATVITSVAGLLFTGRNCRLIATIIAATILFFIRAVANSNCEATPQWAVLADGDLVCINAKTISSSVSELRTGGEMSVFDHRPPLTRFMAQITPEETLEGSHASIEASIRIDGEFIFNKGERLKLVGWLRESATHKNQFTVYVPSYQPKHTVALGQTQKVSLKNTTRSRLLEGLCEEKKQLAGAIFFGIRDFGQKSVSNKFRTAGMSHILAISGLHVGLVVLLAVWTTIKLRAGAAITFVVVLIVVTAVLFLIEPRAPAIRAILVSLIVSFSVIVGLRCNTVGLVGAAALIMLYENPTAAGSAGFQLSFLVVASLCVLLPAIKWRIIGPPKINSSSVAMSTHWFCSLWLTGLCAWLVSTPITANIFGVISPSGLLSSVPAVTALAVTLVTGIFRLVFGWGILDVPIQEMLSISLCSLLWMAKLFGAMPYSCIEGIQLRWYWSLAMLAWVAWWALSVKQRRGVWFSLALMAAGIFADNSIVSNRLTITTINVGHGTCHIVQHQGHTVLIDCGSRHNLDVGENTIVPMLRKLGVSHINHLIITHSDLDHVSGMIDVLRLVSVGSILIAPQTLQHQTGPLQMVIGVAKSKSIPIIEVTSPWSVEHGEMSATVVSPSKDDLYRSSNATSIVLLVAAHHKRVLFTGDIDEKKIKAITRSLPHGLDVIELPHHGQWSKESNNLIRSNGPQVVIQSTNISRHSKDKWDIPFGTNRLVTAVDGTITTTIFENGNIITSGSWHPDIMETCGFAK